MSELIKGISIMFFTVFLIGFLVSISISSIFYILSTKAQKDDTVVKWIITEEEAAQVKGWFDKGYQHSLNNEHDRAIESYTKAIEDYNGAIKTPTNAQKRISSPFRVYFGSVYFNALGGVVLGFMLFGLVAIDLWLVAQYFGFIDTLHSIGKLKPEHGLVLEKYFKSAQGHSRFKAQWWALIILTAITLYYGWYYVRYLKSFTSVEVSNNGSWSLRNAFGIPIGYIGLAEVIEVNYMRGKSISPGTYRESTYHFVEIRAGDKKHSSCNNEIKELEKAMGAVMQNRNSINKALTFYPLAYYNRGVAYYNKRQDDKAVEDYNKAIELDPNYANAYNNRGLIYYNKGEYDMAIEDFNKAIKLNLTFALAWNNRGNAYTKKGDIEMARINYETACDLGYDKGCENLQKIL